MKIVVNGEPTEFQSGKPLSALIESLGLLPEATAVQRNDEVVARSEYASTYLYQDDVIELIRFVGGG